MRRSLGLLAFALAAVACRDGTATAPAPPSAQAARPWEQGAQLLEQGQVDAALAALQAAGNDAETLYHLGRAWQRKAEKAAVPTPPPPPPGHRGVPPRAAEFKREEIEALTAWTQALAARPALGPAHLAVAELLAPHSERRLQQQAAPAPRKGRVPSPAPLLEEGIDFSPERVLDEYQQAAKDPELAGQALQAAITFGRATARPEPVKAAYRGLLSRSPQDRQLMLAFGDFLAEVKAPLDAIDLYAQVLLLEPGDPTAEGRIGTVYLDMAAEALDKGQYAVAQDHLGKAGRYVRDRSSAAGARMAALETRLSRIR